MKVKTKIKLGIASAAAAAILLTPVFSESALSPECDALDARCCAPALRDDSAQSEPGSHARALSVMKSIVCALLAFVSSTALHLLSATVKGSAFAAQNLLAATSAALVSDVLACFFALFVIFALLFKALHPDKKITEFLTFRNTAIILLSSLALNLFLLALRAVFEKSYIVGSSARSAFVLFSLLLTVSLLFGEKKPLKTLREITGGKRGVFLCITAMLLALVPAAVKLIDFGIFGAEPVLESAVLILAASSVGAAAYLCLRPVTKTYFLEAPGYPEYCAPSTTLR
ncbi:MAG: hypothetical protein RSD39_03485 [Oscillospiraceae bacterium]